MRGGRDGAGTIGTMAGAHEHHHHHDHGACDHARDRSAQADAILAEIERACGFESRTVKLHAMLETASGIALAREIASCCPRVTALTLGGQDLTADLGVTKTREGWELFVARSQVALAARS